MLLKSGTFAMELEKKYFLIFLTLLFLLGAEIALMVYFVNSHIKLQEEYENLQQEFERKRQDLTQLRESLKREQKGIEKMRQLLAGKRLFENQREIYSFLFQEAKRNGVQVVLAQAKEPESKGKKRRSKKAPSSLARIALLVKAPSKLDLYRFLIALKEATIYSIEDPERFVLERGILKGTFLFPLITSKDRKRLERAKVL
ncbi:MAG: hypothetical protein C6I00_02865 [Nitratiruptor sp.]|nr:hypothetical protein [Nitratiruptor sp.]NPA82891.1 hypothetical protein [Campylobacterota bacterium]